jgi:hypothetical protein
MHRRNAFFSPIPKPISKSDKFKPVRSLTKYVSRLRKYFFKLILLISFSFNPFELQVRNFDLFDAARHLYNLILLNKYLNTNLSPPKESSPAHPPFLQNKYNNGMI